jgi:aminoglycoside 3-N-acetyltransferase
MSRQPITISELTIQIRELSVIAGGVLLVHTSFSKVGPLENGPPGLIHALQAALEPSGTLVMPSMTDDDDHPFDPRRTPCLGMGVVAVRHAKRHLPALRRETKELVNLEPEDPVRRNEPLTVLSYQ